MGIFFLLIYLTFVVVRYFQIECIFKSHIQTFVIRRCFIQISALSIFDGSVVDYHGDNGELGGFQGCCFHDSNIPCANSRNFTFSHLLAASPFVAQGPRLFPLERGIMEEKLPLLGSQTDAHTPLPVTFQEILERPRRQAQKTVYLKYVCQNIVHALDTCSRSSHLTRTHHNTCCLHCTYRTCCNCPILELNAFFAVLESSSARCCFLRCSFHSVCYCTIPQQ